MKELVCAHVEVQFNSRNKTDRCTNVKCVYRTKIR